MSKLRSFKFGDLVENFDTSRRPIRSSERKEGVTPYYGASGIVDYVDGYTHDGEYLLVSEDGENLRARSKPIAFAVSGRFWANNHVHVVQGKVPADTKFLKYALAVTDINSYLSGTAQPKLSRSAMDSIQLALPDESTRVAIVDVLNCLDDKITANERAVVKSEELMVAIAGTAVARAPLKELAVRATKSVKPVNLGSKVIHFSLPAFDDGAVPQMTNEAVIKSNKLLIPGPCVLVSKLNPRIPRIWNVVEISSQESVASTEFVVLTPKEVPVSSLWSTLMTPAVSREMQGLVAGTSGSHQRVKPEELLYLAMPDPRSLRDAEQRQQDSLGRYAYSLRKQNIALAKTRDELLPLLMSGTITVKDAESVVSSAL